MFKVGDKLVAVNREFDHHRGKMGIVINDTCQYGTFRLSVKVTGLTLYGDDCDFVLAITPWDIFKDLLK